MKYKILVADDDNRQILAYQNLFLADDHDPVTGLEDFFAADSVAEKKPVHRHHSEIELVSANQGEQAIKLVEEHLQRGVPISVAFIDMRMPPGINGLETALKIRELDHRIYIVIVTAYSDVDLKEIVYQLGDNVLFLRKPFQSEEIEQIAFNFVNAWKKDESLRKLQIKLKEKISVNLFEASIYEMMNPILITLADKVNAQAGLISYLQNNALEGQQDSEFAQISEALTSEAIELSSMIKILQQLIHPTKEVMAFTAREAKNRFYSLIPELHHLPENISFNIEVNFDASTTFYMPENYLLIAVMAMVRNSLDSVTEQLLKNPAAKGKIEMTLDLIGDRVHLSLKDNGVGIEPQRLSRLKSMFEYGFESKEDFVGVGLAMVQEFVEFVGGSFIIESEGEGKGVSSCLEFPISMLTANEDR